MIRVLPIDGWPCILLVTKITARFLRPGGYFCAFLVPFYADKTKIENMKCEIKKVNETGKVKTKMKILN